MRAVYFEEASGGPKSLKEGEVHEPIPEDDEVLIRVAAAGVNVEDLWRLYSISLDFDVFNDSPYKSPYIGVECSGEVIATGSKVSNCRRGDRVCAFSRGGGAYAEVVAVPAIFVVVVPLGIPLTHAASLPQATCLTLWCFTVLRKITCGQKILIHGGGGGFGSIAIQYAKYIGCEVYATEGNKQKVQLCKDLGAKVCINYKKEDFCKRVKHESKGKGVDIILDPIGKNYLEKNLDCLSIGGSLIVIGIKGESTVGIDVRILDQKKISILGASLWSVPDQVIRHLLTKAVGFVWLLICRHDIKPVIGRVFKFSEATDALKAMQNCTFLGKILIAP